MPRYKFSIGDKFEISLGEKTVTSEVVAREQVFSRRYNVYELEAEVDSPHPVFRLMNEFQLAKLKQVN